TGGIFHYGRTEDQFLSSGLAGRTQSGRNRRAARPHDWLRRMQYNRRGEPAGRESGFDVHGASRAEGIRTVIPDSSAARLCDTAGINGRRLVYGKRQSVTQATGAFKNAIPRANTAQRGGAGCAEY